MKVILLRDVAKLGQRNRVVDVPDGFALNSLIPKKWAVPATAENLKRLQAKDSHAAEEKMAASERFRELAHVLPTVSITIVRDATPQGSLFQAVKPKDVAEALAAVGYEVPERNIMLPNPVKQVGEHEGQLVHDTMNAPFTFAVIKK